MLLAFDTETTGLVIPHLGFDDDRQPRLVQFAGMLIDDDRRVISCISSIVECGIIPAEASKVHGITTEMAYKHGIEPRTILRWFERSLVACDKLVAHNIAFDLDVMRVQYARHSRSLPVTPPTYCTMRASTDLLKLPGKYGKYKWPKLKELYDHLFGQPFDGAHDALEDVRATVRCYHRLVEMGL